MPGSSGVRIGPLKARGSVSTRVGTAYNIKFQRRWFLVDDREGLPRTSWYGRIWWYFMRGKTISVAWPQVNIDHNGNVYSSSDAVDPRIHYKPWLEENIGKKNWLWYWTFDRKNPGERLFITFAKNKSHYAVEAALRWG